MFEMKLPVWDLMVRATVIYVALMVMVRMTGKRTLGQFTPFDLVVVMLLAEGVSNALGGGDLSLTGGLVVAGTLVALDVLFAFATSRSKRLDKLLDSSPVLVGRDGVIYKDVLKRERVPESDMDQALREHDCALEDMRMAVLEPNGQISIMKKQRPD